MQLFVLSQKVPFLGSGHICGHEIIIDHVLNIVLWYRNFGTKCSGCNQGLCPEDLVRHAMNKVYHVPCFLCSMCRKQMMTGEQVYLVQVRNPPQDFFFFVTCQLKVFATCVGHPMFMALLQFCHFFDFVINFLLRFDYFWSQGDAFLCERCHQLTQSIATKTSISATPSTASVGTTKPSECISCLQELQYQGFIHSCRGGKVGYSPLP